jgi:butyrate kinase
MKDFLILSINPGSTSTKISIYQGDEAVFVKNIKHAVEEVVRSGTFDDEVKKRKTWILNELKAVKGFDLAKVDAFVGRGGGLKPCAGGTYEINEIMIQNAKDETLIHPSIFAPAIAYELAKTYGKKAYTVNALTSDELIDEARFTGIRGVIRDPHAHVLNQKEVAHRAAAELGKKYENMNFIIVHLGGGISVTAHRKGKMVDTTDALVGDGPMSPTRCGAVGVKYIIELCFSGTHTKDSLNKFIMAESGLTSHLGISDGLEIENQRKAGNKYAQAVYDAMIFQIAKSIGSMAAVLEGKVDAILITGGLARDTYLISELTRKTQFIAPLKVYAGEFEMEGLTNGALRVLRGEEKALNYTGIPSFQGFEWDK